MSDLAFVRRGPARAARAGRLRHRALTLAALLVAAALLTPLASGQEERGGLLGRILGDGAPDEAPADAEDDPGRGASSDEKREDREKEREKEKEKEKDDEAPEDVAAGAVTQPGLRLPSTSPDFAPRWGLGVASVGLGVMGLAMLGAAVGLGRLATRPRRPRLGLREAARERALLDAPLDGDGAFRALQAQRYGEVAEMRHVPEESAQVAIVRRRKANCEEIGGYLTGAFESAWGADVLVDHVGCSGRKRKTPCRFDVRAVRRR